MQWGRMLEDPQIAAGQRWYCPLCAARYRTRHGVLVDIVIKGQRQQALYAKADFPPDDIKDLKAMAVEHKLRHATRPQELLASCPTIYPSDRGHITRGQSGSLQAHQ